MLKRKNKEFVKVIPEEQETIINVDYYEKAFHVYTQKKSVFYKLYDLLGEPDILDTIGGVPCSGRWKIPFADRELLRKLLTLNTLIGQIGKK
ncbi:MAG: hypothetical protein IJX99_01365 [Clostridia bacterium]|nr:hypothetical protein [Clostridia bacterium]